MPYDPDPTQERYPFVFATPDEPELRELRERYGLESLVEGGDSDLEKVRRICAWVHARWSHDGLNKPSSSDPLTILEEAGQGKSFRCVEYSVVIAACASALGLPGRILELKTGDAEMREAGAGHVASEVFLPDVKRWVFVDGQWNVIPMRGAQPLSAAEFRCALDTRASVTSFSTVPEVTVRDYLGWIDAYIFYLSAPLDNRRFGVFDKAKLILRPLGAKKLTVFQRRLPVSNASYTYSVGAFYPLPQRTPLVMTE